jgi:hypothetical protein
MHELVVNHVIMGDGFEPPNGLSSGRKYGKWGYPIRNLCLKNVASDYVAFVDDDNVLLPGAFHKWEKMLKTYNPDILFCKMLHTCVGQEQVVFPIDWKICKSNVGTLNYVVRTEIAKQCRFGMDYEGDWTFIEQCMKIGHVTAKLNEICSVWTGGGI